jgi:hypothetical protein
VAEIEAGSGACVDMALSSLQILLQKMNDVTSLAIDIINYLLHTCSTTKENIMDMNPTKRMLITQLEHMICEIVDQKLEERMDLIEASKEFDIGDYTMDINEMISDFINCNVSVEILT